MQPRMPKRGRLGQRAAGVDLEAVVQEEFCLRRGWRRAMGRSGYGVVMERATAAMNEL
jgi:hypothetical protein